MLVWRHLGGTVHRLAKTSSGSTDRGARAGFAMADAFYQGADLANMAADPNSNVLEIAVYGRNTQNAIGVPRVLVSAEDAGVLAADVSRVGDPDGIPNVGSQESTGILHEFSYRWVRVDSGTGVETVVGADSARYRRVEADVGELVKVEVSFTDSLGTVETVTSLPFGPLAGVPRLPSSTLVANTAQTASADATITEQYAMGFRLGDHGQGYEISGVSIELAAAPSSLTVSLWAGPPPGHGHGATARTKLFDFEDPASLAVGLNDFAAPAGTFAYQNHNYHIVLSDFGSSLSIKETTSDNEDTGGETGATLQDKGTRTGVLRLAVKGSQRKSGILVSTYAQIGGNQEIVSVGDQNGVEFTVGTADRYLIRGVTFSLDDTTTHNGGFTNPWELRDGGTELFRMVSTRQIFGINEFTAPQGATVTGTDSYELLQDVDSVDRMGGVTLGRHACTPSTSVDSPSASGVTPRRQQRQRLHMRPAADGHLRRTAHRNGPEPRPDPQQLRLRRGHQLSGVVAGLHQRSRLRRVRAAGLRRRHRRLRQPVPPTGRRRCRWQCTPIWAASPAPSCSTCSAPANTRPATAFSRRRRERRWIRALPMCWCGATSAAPCTGWRRPPAAARTAARGQASPWRTRSIRAPTWPTWPRTPTATCWRSRCTAETPKTPSACRGFWFLRRMRGCWLRTFRVSGILTGSPMWAVRSRRASARVLLSVGPGGQRHRRRDRGGRRLGPLPPCRG